MSFRAVPERTCVGCRGRAPKTELVRVVRTPGGEVLLDPTGRAPGRGAYVHPAGGCIERASSAGFIGRALRRALGPAEAGRLIDELRVYLEEST